MLIGIDGNEANLDKRVGVHQQAFEVLWGLYKLEDSNVEYLIYLKQAPKDDLPKESPRWRYKVIPGSGFWVLTKLTKELIFGKRPDVFFAPSHYLPIFVPCPRVCMITDIGYLEFTGQFTKKDFWQLKYWTAISLFISKYIIAISNSTKNDIVRHYKFASNKIKVIFLGPNNTVKNLKVSSDFVRRTLNKYRITKNYIAFVSTLKPGKNVEGLLTAFSLMNDWKKYQLVISGKKGWMYDSIFQNVKKLGIEENVVFTDYITEAEKKVIIQKAKVFVTPSFWEGFGIDILNAYILGVPAVVSNVGSIPEVAGNAGVYVDPYRPESIKQGLEKIFKMTSKEYNRQVAKGYKQLEKFSWDKCAKETLNVLKKAATK